MPLRSLLLQILSLVVPILAVVFAYQASIRWAGFSAAIKKDWESKFRADTVVGGTGERVRAGKEMMGKTPVYLYVNVLGFARWFLCYMN